MRFDPEKAAMIAFEALEERHATIRVDHIIDGALSTAHMDAILDVADALDLDAVLGDFAAALAAAGDTDPLDVRRAKALGLLARGQTPHATDQSDSDAPARPRRRRPRELVLHVHLAEAALHNTGDGLVALHTSSGHPLGIVTVEQIQDWCGASDTRITVKPILDTRETLTAAGYQPPPRLRDLVVALNPRCVFPFCTRPADNLDLDHIVEHNRGGPTSSENLAPLCRRHHRAKTHAAWSYTRLAESEYLWRSPHGYAFLTDPDGTRDVSGDPPPTPPPGAAPPPRDRPPAPR